MTSRAIDGKGPALEGLHYEVRDDPSISGVHPRSIGVENSGDLDFLSHLPMVVEEEGLGAAFSLVVAGPQADGIDSAPIILSLGVDFWISVDFARRCLQDFAPQSLGQTKHVYGSVNGCLGGLHWIVLIMHRRGRAGQVVYFIYFDVKGKAYVVAHDLEAGVFEQVGYVQAGSGVEIIDAQNFITLAE